MFFSKYSQVYSNALIFMQTPDCNHIGICNRLQVEARDVQQRATERGKKSATSYPLDVRERETTTRTLAVRYHWEQFFKIASERVDPRR